MNFINLMARIGRLSSPLRWSFLKSTGMSSGTLSIKSVPWGIRALLRRLLAHHLTRGIAHGRATGISLFIGQIFIHNSLLRLANFLNRIIVFKATRIGRWSYNMINLLICSLQAKIIVASLTIAIACVGGHLIRESPTISEWFRNVRLGDILSRGVTSALGLIQLLFRRRKVELGRQKSLIPSGLLGPVLIETWLILDSMVERGGNLLRAWRAPVR